MLAVCIIIFAMDINPSVTKEIRNHEYAHCNGWQHPPGWETPTRAYRPPARFLRPFRGEVDELAVTSFEARQRCSGDLGCQRLVQ